MFLCKTPISKKPKFSNFAYLAIRIHDSGIANMGIPEKIFEWRWLEATVRSYELQVESYVQNTILTDCPFNI